MATNYGHPGVYIQEIPSARSIQGAATSVAAFVGVTQIGPIETPKLITSWNEYVRQFGNLVWWGYVSWAVFEFFNEGGSACYVVRAKDSARAVPAKTTLSGITVTATTPGTWANQLQVAIVDASPPPKGVASLPVFNFLIVIDASVIDAPDIPGTPTDPTIAVLQSFVQQNGLQTLQLTGKAFYVLEAFNGFTASSMGTDGQLMRSVNNYSMFVQITVPEVSEKQPPVRPANGQQPLASGTAPTYELVNGVKTLEKTQGISLLCVPDTVTATDAGGKPSQKTQATLINSALAFCESQASLFYVSDPPFGLNVQDMLSFKLGTALSASGNNVALNSSFGAIYYPWVSVMNPATGLNVPMPPSGPVLGRYAHTDLNVGVWKSPAGVSDGALRTVSAIASTVSDNDQDLINPQGINALRNLIGYGNAVYGARTLALGTEWTYVAVRRLFIYVEQSLKQSLQWVVFEPNDQQLWSSVSRDISAFLTTLWQQGGLFGDVARDAFFVTCDTSNNPPETRALGELYIDIGLAPVFPAEFVIIRITQKTAGPDAGA